MVRSKLSRAAEYDQDWWDEADSVRLEDAEGDTHRLAFTGTGSLDVDPESKECADCRFRLVLADVEALGHTSLKRTVKRDAEGNPSVTTSARDMWQWRVVCECCGAHDLALEINPTPRVRGEAITREDVTKKYVTGLMSLDAMERSLERLMSS